MADLGATRVLGPLLVTGSVRLLKGVENLDAATLNGRSDYYHPDNKPTKNDIGLNRVDNFSRSDYDDRYTRYNQPFPGTGDREAPVIHLGTVDSDGKPKYVLLCRLDSTGKTVGTIYGYRDRSSAHPNAALFHVAVGNGNSERSSASVLALSTGNLSNHRLVTVKHNNISWIALELSHSQHRELNTLFFRGRSEHLSVLAYVEEADVSDVEDYVSDESSRLTLLGGEFYGSGVGLTNLDASALDRGTVPNARLPETATRWPSYSEVTGTPATTASRTSGSTSTLLQAKAMNDHRGSGDHDGRYLRKNGDTLSWLVTDNRGTVAYGNPNKENYDVAQTNWEDRFMYYIDLDGTFKNGWGLRGHNSANNYRWLLRVDPDGRVLANRFVGNGSELTNLNAGNLSSGTIPTARLSGKYNIDIGGKADDAVKADSATTATTATRLSAQRQINGTNFDGTGNITTTRWGAGRTLTIGNTGKSVNGSANVSWSLAEIGAVPTTTKVNGKPLTGDITLTADDIGAIGEDASVAEAGKLRTPRQINGTNFDGTGNITTTRWGTARTLTIGSTGKSVNGSGNVSWTLAEIGAAPASHNHAWGNITGAPATATRWPSWGEVTGKPGTTASRTDASTTTLLQAKAMNDHRGSGDHDGRYYTKGQGDGRYMAKGGDVSSGRIAGTALGITNTSNTSGNGLSLYGSYNSGMPTYGISFAGTGSFGRHGSVQGDWATYFTIGGATNRGWVFKSGNGSGGNVASISAAGAARFNNQVVASGYDVQSDDRLKRRGEKVNVTREQLKSLELFMFEWLAGPKKGQLDSGVSAQQVKKIFPHCVGSIVMDDVEYLTVDYGKLAVHIALAKLHLEEQ